MDRRLDLLLSLLRGRPVDGPPDGGPMVFRPTTHGVRVWAAEREAVEAARAGGATWWLEFVAPGDPSQMLDAVRAGPVRAG